MDLSSRIQNFFNSKKKQLGQAVQQAPQQLQSFGENLLEPQNITNAVTNIGSFFAPQTKPFIQSKPIQNVMTGMATGLSNTVKEGLPAAYRISPLNPQRSPLKINNGQLGFNLFNTPTMPSIKQDISDTLKVGKLAATVYGIPKLTAGSLLASGGLGGGLNKLFGGSFSEGAGQGLSSAPVLSGIGSVTNPLISNVSSRLASGVNNPLGKLAVDRVATGVMNIPEGLVMKGALTNNPYDITDAGLDFGMGVLGGSNKLMAGKGMVMRKEYPKVIPKIEENIKDVIVRYAKAFGEGQDPTRTVADINLQDDAVQIWKTMYGDKPVPKGFNGVNLERVIGDIKEGWQGWRTELEMAGQGIRMGFAETPKIESKLSDALQAASNAQEEAIIVKQFVDAEIRNAKGNSLKATRAALNKDIQGLVGIQGSYKQNYAALQILKNDPSIGPRIQALEEGLIKIDETLSGNKNVANQSFYDVEHARGTKAASELGGFNVVGQKNLAQAEKTLQKAGELPSEIKVQKITKDFIKDYYQTKKPPVVGDVFINAKGERVEITKVTENAVDYFLKGQKKGISGTVYLDSPRVAQESLPNQSFYDTKLYSGSDKAKGSRYFTVDKEYAGIHGKNITELSIPKTEIFDTRNPQHRQVFESLGLKRAIDEKTGLPISTGDAKELENALQKAGLNFKAIALSENTGLGGTAEISYFINKQSRVAQESISDTKLIPSEVVKKQPVTPKEFIPTKDWKEYTPDQTLPIGMEVKMENGKQYARIPEGENVSSVKQIMDNRQSPLGSTLPPGGRDLDSSSDVVEQVFKTKKFNVTKEGAEMLDEQRKDLGFDVRKVKHFDEMKTEGKELQGDLRSLLKRNKNDIVTDSEVSALSDVASTSTDRILKLTKQLDQDPSNTTIKKQIEIEEALLDQVLAKQIKGGTAAGRAVVAFRILANKTLDRNFWINKAKKQLGDDKKLNAQVIGKIDELVKSKDRIGLAVYIGKLGESTFGEKAVGLWKASLLTGFRTHEANMLGNEIMRNLETVKDIPATMFDVVRAGITGGKRTKSFSFNLKGQGEGLKKGAIRAKEIIKTGADSQDLAKAEMHKPLRFGKTPLGRVGQTVTNAVFRTLGAEDKIPFEMNFRRSLEEQAKVIKNNDKLTPQQMRELIESPTEKMLATATKDAAYATFTSENAVNDAIRAAKRAGGGKVSAALDVIMPFTKTPTNVAKATFVDYTPVGFVGEAARVVKNLVTKQPVDERALAEAFGRAATGTTILALGAELAKRGLISGSSPTSEAERSQWELENKTPNSVFINGKWRNVGRISPMGNLLLLGAVAEETGYDPEKTAFSGIKGFSENSFLRGAAGGLKAITEPDRFADSFVENTIAGYIPNLLSDVAAGVDTADKRDPKGLKERMLVKVPGLGRESVPEKLNALGEVKENERGLLGKMFDLFNSSKPTDDPLINEFKRVGYNLNYVGNAIGGKTLTRAEEREYQELAGKYIKELVPQVIQSDGYSELSTDQQKDLIERAVNSAKTQAREQIKPKLGLIQDESGIAADAAEDDEYGSVSSNIDLTVNKDGKKNITKTFIQDGKLKTVTVDFNINKPELSGDTDFDKKLLSKYKGKVTTEINDVYNLYEAGKLSLTQAKEAIALLEDKYKTGSSGGGGKSKKGAKIDYRQFVKAIKPVKVTVSKSRSKPYKAPTIKAPSVKQPSLKQLKYKGKVMSLRKKK